MLHLIALILVFAVVMWLIESVIPMSPFTLKIVRVVVVLLVLIWLLGILGTFGDTYPGRIRW